MIIRSFYKKVSVFKFIKYTSILNLKEALFFRTYRFSLNNILLFGNDYLNIIR